MYLSRSVRQTARAAICRADGVVKSLHAGCDDWTPGCPCRQPQSETDLQRPLAGDLSARSEMNMRTAGNYYIVITPLMWVRICTSIQTSLRCIWTTRALHFPRKIKLVLSMRPTTTTFDWILVGKHVSRELNNIRLFSTTNMHCSYIGLYSSAHASVCWQWVCL